MEKELEKKKSEFAFVILHYNTTKETDDCVESIKNNIDTDDYFIVIVDNNSPNGSGAEVMARYKDCERVKVILNKENLGFAKGNNIGLAWARKELKSDFIVCLNNDTIMIEKHFTKKVKKEWARSHFGVLGPKILDKNKKITLNWRPYSLKTLEGFCIKYQNRINNKDPKNNDSALKKRLKGIAPLRSIAHLVIIAFQNIKRAARHTVRRCALSFRSRGVYVMQGSCFIFSTVYFEHYNGFYDKTFLFREEDLLFFMCKKAGIEMVYNPAIKIWHLEGVSRDKVKKSLKDENEKRIFNDKHHLDSTKILIDYMKENGFE